MTLVLFWPYEVKKDDILQVCAYPSTFSFLAYLPRNWGRAKGWIPRDSIRGPIAHQTHDPGSQASVAARAAIWWPFEGALGDVAFYSPWWCSG